MPPGEPPTTEPTNIPDLWKVLAARVYERRIELGMHTQKELADQAGVHVNTIGRIESGVPSARRSPSWPKIEEALQWPAGHIATISQGLEPDRTRTSKAMAEAEKDMLAVLVDKLPDRTGAQIRELLDELLDTAYELGARSPLVDTSSVDDEHEVTPEDT